MKKMYDNPVMCISIFNTENIVTASGETVTTAAEYAKDHAYEIFGTDGEIKAVLVF